VSEEELNRIAEFLCEHNKYTDREMLKGYLREHGGYGTLDYGIDTDGNIVSVVRYNLSNDGSVADILDFAIRHDFRNKGLGKDFILRALKKWPNIKKLKFMRGVRGDGRIRELNIKGILERNIF
jgi:GNAT superfamily N-acetyltransferase